MNRISDIAGWIGVILILGAYVLNNFEILTVQDIYYSLMNLLGAGFIIWSSDVKKDFQPVVLNIVWLIVAAIGVAKIIF